MSIEGRRKLWGWCCLGGVARDHEGEVIVAMCSKVEGNFGADVAEAMAAR